LGQNLGKHAEKWINLLLEEGFRLEKFFSFPVDQIENQSSFLLEVAETIWSSFNTLTELKTIDEILPCWLIFALPRIPSFILYALWENILQQNKVSIEKYLSLQNTKILEKYLEEEIHINALITPFRIALGLPDTHGFVSTHEKEISPKYELYLLNFSTIERMNDFFKTLCIRGTFKTGISGLEALEEMASTLNISKSIDEQISYFMDELETITNETKQDLSIQPVSVNEIVEKIISRYIKSELSDIKPASETSIDEGVGSEILTRKSKIELKLSQYYGRIKEIEDKIERLASMEIGQDIDQLLDDLEISFINLKIKLEQLIIEEENEGNDEGKKQIFDVLENLDRLEKFKNKIGKKFKKENEKLDSAMDVLKSLRISGIFAKDKQKHGENE